MEQHGQDEQQPQAGYGQAPIAPYAPPPPKQGWSWKRKAWVIAGSVFAFFIVVGAIGDATKKPVPVAAVSSPSASALATSSPAGSTPTVVPKPSVKPAALATPTAPGIALTGFGATQAQWAAHHVPDENNGPDFWNPNPALPPTTTGGVNDEYIAVTFAGSPARALTYDLLMTPRSLSAAEAKVALELPPDAVPGKPIYDFKGLMGAQCVEVDYTSATLGKVLGGAHGNLVYAVYQSAQANTLDVSQIEWVALVSAPQDTDTGTNAC